MQVILFYYSIINIIALLCMGLDKYKAIKHRYRVPESLLFLLTLCGGVLGTSLGMFLFHHKIHKNKFYIIIGIALLVHLVIFIRLDIISTIL